MLTFKQTGLLMMALASGTVFAGAMGPSCKSVDVTTPCETLAWDIGGRGLYIQASNSTAYGQNTIDQNSASLTTGVNPAWGWGFQLETAYHFGTGNDFNVNWYHSRSGGQVVTLATPVTLTNPNNIFNAAPITAQAAQGSVSPSWDQVNVEFAQHVDFGEHKFARIHGGVNFSRVGNGGYHYFYLTTVNNNVLENFSQKTIRYNLDFNGFGPRVGTDLNYEWNNGLGVYATGAISILAGSTKSAHEVYDWLTPENGYTFSVQQPRVISELDAKLGAMYTYSMPQGDLSMDIGWMWANYANALIVGEYLNQAKPHNVSFGVQGLYFGLKWISTVP